jgi:outer membrane protein assembly factor BamB
MTFFLGSNKSKAAIAGAVLLMLCGCSTFSDIGDWLGGEKAKVPLPGTRIAVLSESSNIQPDESLATTDVTIPDPTSNDDWRQAGGDAGGATGNLQLSGYTHHDSVTIGDGNGWEQPLYPSPIIANHVVYAMDAKGYITAHSTADIGKILWTNNSLVAKEEPDLLGGGLALDGTKIYATSGRGSVAAIDAATGKEIWKQFIGVPLRAAPKVGGGKVYALSVDNQLFALDADKGAQLWSHRGINENAGFLAAISPALSDTIVLAPYSSGEIHALDTVSGQDVWNDSLLLPRRNYATAGFYGIGGNPIIKDNIIYATDSGGSTVALGLLNGRRIWEQDISSLNSPWVAGDYMYILSNEDQLVCLTIADGRVKWVRQIARYANEEKHRDPLTWRGPIMAGGQLLIAGIDGRMLALSPKDGSTIATVEIPENITDTPVVAGGRLYMLTQDAKLHVLY